MWHYWKDADAAKQSVPLEIKDKDILRYGGGSQTWDTHHFMFDFAYVFTC